MPLFYHNLSRLPNIFCGSNNSVEKFWNDTTLDELLTMTKSDMISRLTALAAEYSTDGIVITINTEKIHFEHTEEIPEVP